MFQNNRQTLPAAAIFTPRRANLTVRFFATLALASFVAAPLPAATLQRLYGKTVSGDFASLTPLSATNWFVSAAGVSGHLQVTTYKNDPANARITELDTYPGPSILNKASVKPVVARLSNNRFVTGSVTPAGYFQVIVWSVDNTGNITQLGTQTITGAGPYQGGAGVVQGLSITPFGSSRVVTYIEMQTNTPIYGVYTHLTSWNVDTAGNITQQDETVTAVVPGGIAVTADMYATYVVTACNQAGKVSVASYLVDAAGKFQYVSYGIMSIGTYNANVALTPVLANGNFTLASATTNTQVVQWNLNFWTGVFTQLGSNTAPGVNTAMAMVGSGAFTLSSTKPGIRADVWSGVSNGVYVDTAWLMNSHYVDTYSAAPIGLDQIITASENSSNQMQFDFWQWNP